MWTMEQHIRELKDMRRVARDEGITNASLAQYLKVPETAIFFIMTGKTQKGELRDRVYQLLASNEVAAAWNKSLIMPTEPEPEPPTKEQQTTEVFTEAERFGPASEGAHRRMHAAWKALGISQGELGERFNRSAASVAMVLSGNVVKGRFFDALRAHLLEGQPPVIFDAWPNKGNKHTRTVAEQEAAAAVTVAPAQAAAVAPPPDAPEKPRTVVRMVQNTDSEIALQAQVMALEELAEATKDLLILKQAEKRYATAVAIARSVGLHVGTPALQTRAA